jgi:hypothetical protein
MAELFLGKAHRRDYGTRYEGYVVRDDGEEVDITYRATKKRGGAKAVYGLVNGLTAGKATMRLPAVVGANKGYDTITFDYSNKRIKDALHSNAQDLAAVLASAEHEKKRAIGLSEGGRVATKALTLIKMEAATFVAPAGYILNNNLSLAKGALVLSAVGPEMAKTGLRHPVSSAHLIASCLRNCFERPFGVAGEMNELKRGGEHDIVHAIKGGEEPPVLTFMYGERDKLLQAVRQAAGTVGLPLDAILSYPGGHCDLATDPNLSSTIYTNDETLLATRDYSLPLAA